MSFIAKFSGTECAVCEERVREGEEVAYNTADRLVHVVCPERLDPEPRKICPSCWMELPVSGVCGECS